MKPQSILWLTGGLAASVFTFSPLAMANTNSASGSFALPAEVQLEPEQETQLTELKEQTKTRLEDVLSSEQQAQLEASLDRGESFRDSVQALDLSFRQRRKVRNIFQDVRSQVSTILTPEQKELIEQEARSQR